MQPTDIKRKSKTPEQALASLMRLCARAERSSGDARRLMRTWGVAEQDAGAVLDRLLRERFIDDSRYATAFVREKSRLGGWGPYKIRTALQRKEIAREIIDRALAEIDRTLSLDRLMAQLQRKARTAKAATPYELKGKLMRYGLSLGFDFETVADAVAATIKGNDRCD